MNNWFIKYIEYKNIQQMQNKYNQSYSEYSELESSQTPGSKFPDPLPFKCASKLDLNVETFTELPDP